MGGFDSLKSGSAAETRKRMVGRRTTTRLTHTRWAPPSRGRSRYVTRKRLVGWAMTTIPRPTHTSWVGTSGLTPKSGVGKAGAAR